MVGEAGKEEALQDFNGGAKEGYGAVGEEKARGLLVFGMGTIGFGVSLSTVEVHPSPS